MIYQERLEKSDLFHGLSVVHLKFYGLWDGINDYRSSRKTSKLFKFNMALSILYVFPFVVFQFFCIFIISFDLKTATFVFMNGVAGAQVFFKIIVFCYSFKDQCDLVDLFKVDYLSSIPESKRSEVNKIYQQNSFRCNIFTVLAFTGNVLTIITWTILPGFDTEKTGTGRKKILSGWYPVPYSESPWYEIVFGYEVILTCWHGSLVSLYESFLLMLLVALYSHFVVLGYHLSTLKKNKAVLKVGIDSKSDNFLNRELRKIQLDYDKLLRYSTLLRTTYNALITATLGMDISVLIFTILFIIFGSSDALSTFKLMVYFSFALIEITLLCVTSSFVESASTAISDSIYSSDWYLADKKFATTAQMIMIRAMRPVGITALKMYPVNMETLIGIYRFIYSAVAVLSKMRE